MRIFRFYSPLLLCIFIVFLLGDDEISTIESLRFELDNIKAATNNFSPDNNIGVGGFGDVFKVQSERSRLQILLNRLNFVQTTYVMKIPKLQNESRTHDTVQEI